MEKKSNILLVEDNAADAELLIFLCKEAGYQGEFTWMRDGELALEYINKNKQDGPLNLPKMVLLDLGLPRINGHEVLQAIRKDDALKDLPVVVLSTSSSPQDIQSAKENGAKKFVTKPLELKEFEKLAADFVAKDFYCNLN